MRPFRNALLLALCLLVTVELGMHAVFARNMSGRFEYGYHPTAGFVERPDGRVDLVRAGGRRFRPQAFARHPPPGVFRVMVVGDSVPRGSSLETAYPERVADLLRARGISAESINLAVAGNGAHRSQIILRKALEFRPSLVILHVNNSNEYEDEREYRRSEEFKGWHPRGWLMKSLVIRRLYEAKTEQLFWKWLPTAVRRQQSVSDADAEIAASLDARKLAEWDERVRRFTAESVALARQAGVPVLLLTQAGLQRLALGPAQLDDNRLDALVEPLRGPGVCHLSTKRILEPLPFAGLFADSAHLYPKGHEILAAAIVELLIREGLVRPAR